MSSASDGHGEGVSRSLAGLEAAAAALRVTGPDRYEATLPGELGVLSDVVDYIRIRGAVYWVPASAVA